MIRVALYARVSTEEQATHGYSIDAQKDDLIAYAKEHNMFIQGIYVDEGISARKRFDKRKEFVRLIESVISENIDLILFTKLDRWFRNISDYYKVQEILEKHHVNWKTIYEDYETSTAGGRLKINIMLSVAQDEADRTSERIKNVFKSKIKNKQVVTGKQPYGYIIVNKKIEIDNEKSKIIRDIFEYYRDNRSIYSTQRHINLKYNISKCYDFYAYALHNSKYTGAFRDISDYYPQIVDKKLFDSVQDKKNSFVRENQTKRIYLFSGLVRCSECDHNMNGMLMVTSKNKFYVYRCKQAASMSLCDNKHVIREDKIESYLLSQITDLYKEYEADKVNQAVKKPYIDKSKIKMKLKKLKELYLNDLICMEEYKKDYEEYNRQLAEAEEQEKNEKDINTNDDTEKSIRYVLNDLYDQLDRSSKRAFWSRIIKRIDIDINHNIHVVF